MSQARARLPTVSRRLRYVSVFLLAGAADAVLSTAGYPLVGVGAWLVLCGGGLGYRYLLDRPLFDERDQRLSRVAARQTICVVGIGAAILFPGAVILRATGYIDWPPWLSWLGLYTAGLGFIYTGLRLRIWNAR